VRGQGATQETEGDGHKGEKRAMREIVTGKTWGARRVKRRDTTDQARTVEKRKLCGKRGDIEQNGEKEGRALGRKGNHD